MLNGVGRCCGQMAPPEHAPTFHLEHAFPVLVVHDPLGSHQAHIGFGAHGP